MASAALAAGVILLGAGLASAAPGDLDSTFGTGGIGSCGPGSGSDQVLTGDGRLVIAGATPGVDAALVCRLTRSGQPDPTFGTGGRVTTDILPSATGFEEALVVARAFRGRLLVAGVAGEIGSLDVFVARYMPDGTLDPSFDGDGIQTITVPAARPTAIDLRPDGHITVAAMVGDQQVALIRFLYGGSVDRTFGTGGVRMVPVPLAVATTAAFDRSGRAIVAGPVAVRTGTGFGAVRLTTNGDLDSEFGDGGVARVEFPFPTSAPEPSEPPVAAVRAVAPAPDGALILAGQIDTALEETHTAVARLTASGRPDTPFGDRGTVVTRVSTGGFPISPSDRAFDVAVMPDGRVVVAGTAILPGAPSATVLRYLPDGTLDPLFGDNGLMLVNAFAAAEGVAVQRDGSVLAREGLNVARLQGDTADLALSGTVERLGFRPGFARLRFMLTVRNDGPHAAPNVVVANALPAGATSQTASSSRGRCSDSGRFVRCRVGTLAVGEERSVFLTVIVPWGTTDLITRPFVSSGAFDPDIADNARRFVTSVSSTP